MIFYLWLLQTLPLRQFQVPQKINDEKNFGNRRMWLHRRTHHC